MSKEQTVTAVGGCIGMLVLILDAQTALAGAMEGMKLCLWTIIPALFPFFVVSNYLTGSLSPSILRPLGKLCRIPQGSEALLLVGMLGGYPVGAQCIARETAAGNLSQQDAHRMLGFCSNAGPAFLFGIVASQLGSLWLALVLWGIHLCTAIGISALLPCPERGKTIPIRRTAGDPMGASIRAICYVCGWAVLFRIVIAVADRWFLWLLSEPMRTLAVGLLELTNGCCEAATLLPGTRFVLCATFLGFGGLCILMQTMSVTKDCGLGMYFAGKVLHGSISALLAFLIQPCLFPAAARMGFHPILLLPVAASLAIIWRIPKKTVEKSRHMVYTRVKQTC